MIAREGWDMHCCYWRPETLATDLEPPSSCEELWKVRRVMNLGNGWLLLKSVRVRGSIREVDEGNDIQFSTIRNRDSVKNNVAKRLSI